jgi:hypothetical protein
MVVDMVDILVDMPRTLEGTRVTLVTTVNTMEVTLPITATSSIFTVSITSFITGSEAVRTA